jgi:GAF domain-containing protein
VPVFSDNGDVSAVLDIDSKELATFDDTDRRHLETIMSIMMSNKKAEETS